MSPAEFPLGTSRIVPGRYPPPGTDPYADAIRERRGVRGITPLDANLLHVPPIAGGFNSLLGAVRNKGSLPGDIREAMILRVAAINHAAFEWIHHEIVGRKEGLSTGQLYVIRDTETPLPPSGSILTPLQALAIAFTDHSTRDIRVPMEVVSRLKEALKAFVKKENTTLVEADVEAKVDDLYVEAAMVVASYNMVSRFLLSTDVAGMSDKEVPWPVDRKEHYISLPSFPPDLTVTHSIHALTLESSPTAPWVVFSNSLLTDFSMWNYVIPHFLNSYNILLHSQRGHGKSTLPSSTSESGDQSESQDVRKQVTIPLLAADIANLLVALSIPTPVHSVIGVSQGGATALAFAAMYTGDNSPAKTKSVVACDTAPRTPAGNKEAWEERIRLVHSEATTLDGMDKLAEVTVPRWFPLGSICSDSSSSSAGHNRAQWIRQMIQKTDVNGFVQGARALSDYDLIDGRSNPDNIAATSLLESKIENVLLIAGSLDGGGKVGQGLQNLCTTWNAKRGTSENSDRAPVLYREIGASGHLPMIDSTELFGSIVVDWLEPL